MQGGTAAIVLFFLFLLLLLINSDKTFGFRIYSLPLQSEINLVEPMPCLRLEAERTRTANMRQHSSKRRDAGAFFIHTEKMDDLDFNETTEPSLLDDDFCIATTEEDSDEYIPYSLRMLLEQKRREQDFKNKKTT